MLINISLLYKFKRDYMFRVIKLCLLLILILFCAKSTTFGQSVYNWDNKKDGRVLAASAVFWGGSRYLVAVANDVSVEQINALDKNNIWSFDRSAVDNLSPSTRGISDIFLYSSVSLPFLHYLNPTCRKEGFAITGMTLQAFFITDGITNFFKVSTRRLRPYTYNPNVSIDEKLKTEAKFSFISGHTSNTALFSVMSAKIYADIFPNSKLKPYIWTAALLIPSATGYFRYRSGRHFPTDVMGGFIVGASIGYLIPHLHKISTEELSFELLPVPNGMLLACHKMF